MSQSTSIEWTDATWNPVHGCSRVSAGCRHCYAEKISRRVGITEKPWEARFAAENVRLMPHKLDEPLRWRKPRMVFVNSMSDLFHERVPDEYILAVWAVMEAAPQHTFQILTKRPERMRDLLGTERPVAPPQPPYDRQPIPNWRGYFVDNVGVVWSTRRGAARALKPDAGPQGHLRVPLFAGAATPRHGERKLVHELVLTTFNRPRREGEQACHRDGNPGNNRISNLYWGTQAENWADRNRHGNGRSHSKLTVRQVAELRIEALQGKSAYSLGKRFGISDTQARNIIRGDQWGFKTLPGVWLGVSIENREWVGRADVLRATPAAVRFISAEPLLGPLLHDDLDERYGRIGVERTCWSDGSRADQLDLTGIDWLIVGGESGGPAHRALVDEHGQPREDRVRWVQDLRDAAVLHAGTAFFFKQWGGVRAKAGGRLLDGRTWDEMPEGGNHR